MELIVAGFHRSGTSFTTQTLARSGLLIGDDLLGTDQSNPYGHFEDREVVRLHDDILRSNGTNWQVSRPFMPVVSSRQWARIERIVVQRRKSGGLWGFKDPRVCNFLGLWKHVLPDSKTLVIYRHYGGCVRSLHRRHGTQLTAGSGPGATHRRFFEEPDLGLKMWLHHNKALIREARRRPSDTMVVSFESMAEGYPLIARLVERWGLTLSDDQASAYDPSATRHENRLRVLDPNLLAEADRTLESLHELHAA